MATSGVGYHHASAADTKERTLRFVDRYLRTRAGEGFTEEDE
ncbi:MAG: hypothetical protein ACRYF3_14725 [Janthinobacterium lividum]